MVDMFGWFKNTIEEVKAEKNNYKLIDDKIELCVRFFDKFFRRDREVYIRIPNENIISHTEDSIICKHCITIYNFNSYTSAKIYENNYEPSYIEPIEKKENLIKYNQTQIKTFKYIEKGRFDKHIWMLKKSDVVEKEVLSEMTPLEVFKEHHESKYKLIETEEEFNEYMSSTLDCNTWCRKKVYNKMKELGLGDGFINQFADLIGNDLNKYYAMIDLAGEVTDKDTLMYLYTYKFRDK